MKKIDDIVKDQLKVEKEALDSYISNCKNPRFGKFNATVAELWSNTAFQEIENDMRATDQRVTMTGLVEYLDRLHTKDSETLEHAQQRIDSMLTNMGLPVLFQYNNEDVVKIKKTLKSLYTIQSYIVRNDYPDKDIDAYDKLQDLYEEQFLLMQQKQTELLDMQNKLYHLREYITLCEEIEKYYSDGYEEDKD